MNCLVLGGGGFLGSHLCEGLLQQGYSVRVFEKSFINRNNIAHLLEIIEYMEGDFSNPVHIQEALKGIDIIFHLISTTTPKDSNDNPVYDITTNLISTIQLLDLSVKERVKKVIFYSSGGTVYGIPRIIPIQEEHPKDPICSYGIHKLTVEKYLQLYHHLYGLDYAILRISNPYGERQRPTGKQGVVAVFLNKAIKKEAIEIWGDGSVVRDYLYVTDVISATMKILNYEGKYKIFNIGSGIGLSLKDILYNIEQVMGYPIDVKYLPGRKLDVPANVLDISRISIELSWSPAVGFYEGLKQTNNYLTSELLDKQK